LAVFIIFTGIFSFLPIRNALYRWKALDLGPTVPIDAGSAKIGDAMLAGIDSALTERAEDLGGYAIEIYEVTYERYSLCVKAEKCSPPNGTFDIKRDARKPVSQVTVAQAMEFCSWIDRRLPNELEWERAARSAEGWKWPWSDSLPPTDDLHANLNYERVSPDKITTNEVGNAQDGPSTEGVFDLIGNVWEWTCTPQGEEPNSCWMDPSSPSIPAAFMIRGGGAASPASPALVSAYREGAEWDNNISPFIGFRCVESR
jgi:formylglycine-generating enzyme required for sulfatase activity